MGASEPNGGNATLMLIESAEGDQDAARRLAPAIYDNLRRLAASRLGASDWTCQPTAIVHEAFLRMVDQDRVDWKGRTHFFAVSAEMVRRVIADEARRRNRQKRGGPGASGRSAGDGRWRRVTIDAACLEDASTPMDPLELEDALTRLTAIDPRAGRVVELRFFGGLTEAETAALLDISERTARNDWRTARAWLRRELARGTVTGEGGRDGAG
jgi:RNA polymerase sigma factor (TIGR02999 family)